MLGALLIALAGAAFALTSNVLVLVAAAAIGTVSPSGSDVGPFLSHVVANVLVMLVPLMPAMSLAVGMWLARYLFAQMERPARQSYTMAIVDENERDAASGFMAVARNAAAAVAPSFAGATLAAPALGLPFLCAGGLKLLYDGAFYLLFRGVPPPEEAPAGGQRRG